MRRRMAATATAIAGVSLAAGYSVYDHYKRPLKFWREMFPIYLHYRIVDMQYSKADPEKRSERFKQLHNQYSKAVLDMVLDLKGLFIKAGQVGASREDMLPLEYRKEFKVLLDRVPSMPFDKVKVIVERSMGIRSLDEKFSEFEEQAIGAASIGQVHKARWRETGEQVVVKVKYTDSEDIFRSDIKTMRAFSKIAQPENLPAINELERQFLKEFDFANEGKALEIVKRNLKSQFPQVIIPQPVYYNRDIVVMEYIPGVKLIDAVMDDYRRYAERLGVTLDELMEKRSGSSVGLWKRVRFGAEDALRLTGRLFKSVGVLAYNGSYGLLTSQKAQYPKLWGQLNARKALKTLLEVHGHEIFIDGVFNGDPHAGNILLTPDGRLGLIDYGQVKVLTVEQRKRLAEFVIAIANGERERIIDMMYGIGYKTQKMDRNVAYKTAVLVFDRDDLEATDGLGFQNYLAALDKEDRIVSTPEYYMMVARVCLLLRGLGMLLNLPPVSVARCWKPICEKCLKSDKLEEVTELL